ncbi:MAG: hypothetical protein ACLR2G_00310 [Phascolarctobacterium faecium]
MLVYLLHQPLLYLLLTLILGGKVLLWEKEVERRNIVNWDGQVLVM